MEILKQIPDLNLNPVKVCHRNLNSISAHNFTKLSLLQAYNSVHNYDIICLSETYLNSSVSCDDDNLEIPGYNLIRADHPSDNRRGTTKFITKIHYL